MLPLLLNARDSVRCAPHDNNHTSSASHNNGSVYTARNAKSNAQSNAQSNEKNRRYWRHNLNVLIPLLLTWFAVSFGASIIGVQTFNGLSFFGMPFGFWMAQQGSIYIFVVLIFVYAFLMDRIDHNFKHDHLPAGGVHSASKASTASTAAKAAKAATAAHATSPKSGRPS